MRQRAFTLIELLVVVAIIALLIAILLPSLGRAKASAVRVKCAAVLKQWGAVTNLYATEYDGVFGLRGTQSGSPTWCNGFYDAEWSSKYSNAMRFCPGDTKTANLFGSGVVATGASFKPDYASVRFYPNVSGKTLWRMTELSHPNTTMLLIDSDQYVTNSLSNYAGVKFADFDSSIATTATPGTADLAPSQPAVPSGKLSQIFLSRHMGLGNVLFVDAHVEQHTAVEVQSNILVTNSATLSAADSRLIWTQLAPQ